jgi:transcriptional regulator with XRE-family HTH domain
MSEQNYQKAEFNRDVLKWAREDSDVSAGRAAQALDISEEEYALIEAGEKDISTGQLRLLSQLTGRPFGFFFLPQPPAVRKAASGKRFVRVTVEAVVEFDAAKTAEEIKADLSKSLYAYRSEEILDLIIAGVADEGVEFIE